MVIRDKDMSLDLRANPSIMPLVSCHTLTTLPILGTVVYDSAKTALQNQKHCNLFFHCLTKGFSELSYYYLQCLDASHMCNGTIYSMGVRYRPTIPQKYDQI